MRLIAFSLESYRRFVSKTSVKLHGDLVAFVGPNEAGKSSLLRAIAHLHNNDAFEQNERPRRKGSSPKLTWHFQLDEDDKEALRGVFDTSHLERLVITKTSNEAKIWGFEPRLPSRDRSGRIDLSERLTTYRGHPLLRATSEAPDSGFNFERYDSVLEILNSATSDYTDDEIRVLDELAASLRTIDASAFVEQNQDEDTDNVSKTPLAQSGIDFGKVRDDITNLLVELAAAERLPSPWSQAVEILRPRLPQIVLFRTEDRELASQYDLAEVATQPPPALKHLANLAQLDMEMLLTEVQQGAIADIGTRRNAANKNLITEFDKSWNQQGIAIQIEVQGQILHIQATTPEDSGLSDIAERSDGMRWFAALLAFSHGWKDAPILLVDEIETHLHYDAQADLIAVLSNQQFTSKVIYTTHSFGCLPYDLGTGVRVVQPLDQATSRLENGFWKTGAGFSPLLASMGAAATSFTPTRRALIGEGPSEAILLPTLLRQSSGESRLGFQVAPGLSGVAAMSVRHLETEAGTVSFLVDGDPGGLRIKQKLLASGISEERILILRDDAEGALEIEDFVDSSIYVRAVNEELRCWTEIETEMAITDLRPSLRTKAVDGWCLDRKLDPPDKTAVAQRVVDFSTEHHVYAADRQENLKGLLHQIRLVLGVPHEATRITKPPPT
jgi:predicted ATP-dependent endonuclease of OLD family